MEGLEYPQTSSRYAQVRLPLPLPPRNLYRDSVFADHTPFRSSLKLRFQALIREHHDDIARSIVLEQGKTFADAKGDVLRGLQMSLLPLLSLTSSRRCRLTPLLLVVSLTWSRRHVVFLVC